MTDSCHDMARQEPMTPPFKMGHPYKMWQRLICIFPTSLLSASYNFTGLACRRAQVSGPDIEPSLASSTGGMA
jgi:hypothetical protein